MFTTLTVSLQELKALVVLNQVTKRLPSLKEPVIKITKIQLMKSKRLMLKMANTEVPGFNRLTILSPLTVWLLRVEEKVLLKLITQLLRFKKIVLIRRFFMKLLGLERMTTGIEHKEHIIHPHHTCQVQRLAIQTKLYRLFLNVPS